MANSVNVGTTHNSITYTIPNTSSTQIHVGGYGGSGSSGYAYSNTTSNSTTLVNSSGKTVMQIPAGEEAIVQITGKIKWNGEDLQERIERIESMLHIPTRDTIMEEKYKKLKKLWNEYQTALEEYKTWERLKDSK
jgi:hypothetical protein